MTITILITRPEPEASRFAEALRAQFGGSVRLLSAPLMKIAYGGDLPTLSGQEVLIFTSRHGVTGFCRLSPRRDLFCYAVGEATAEAARDAGFAVVSARGDADALVARIAAEGRAGPFLHPRGAHVAADIVGALQSMGHAAQDAVVYDQIAVDLDPTAQAVLDGPWPVILPLMSPRSARLFFDGVPAARAPLLVAAISRKAARMVPEGAVEAFVIAETPDLAGMIAALHDLVTAAKRLETGNAAQ
jgi:uroporphyrinogen-III synthase